MSLISQILSKLEAIVTSLGVSVPTIARPANEEDRVLQLLDSIASGLSTLASSGTVPIVLRVPTASLAVDQVGFTADRAYTIQSISYVHSTSEVTNPNLTCYLNKVTVTSSPSAGTAASTSSFLCTAAANTVQSSTPHSTGGVLAAGNRLGIRFVNGSANELAGVVITVILRPS